MQNPDYKPCEELFPQWKLSRIILSEICDNIIGWRIDNANTNGNGNIGISYCLPEKLVGIIPEEDIEKVGNIVMSVILKYSPNIQHLLGQKITKETCSIINSLIQEKEDEIINKGGVKIENEIRFRLGLTPEMRLSLEVR